VCVVALHVCVTSELMTVFVAHTMPAPSAAKMQTDDTVGLDILGVMALCFYLAALILYALM